MADNVFDTTVDDIIEIENECTSQFCRFYATDTGRIFLIFILVAFAICLIALISTVTTISYYTCGFQSRCARVDRAETSRTDPEIGKFGARNSRSSKSASQSYTEYYAVNQEDLDRVEMELPNRWSVTSFENVEQRGPGCAYDAPGGSNVQLHPASPLSGDTAKYLEREWELPPPPPRVHSEVVEPAMELDFVETKDSSGEYSDVSTDIVSQVASPRSSYSKNGIGFPSDAYDARATFTETISLKLSKSLAELEGMDDQTPGLHPIEDNELDSGRPSQSSVEEKDLNEGRSLDIKEPLPLVMLNSYDLDIEEEDCKIAGDCGDEPKEFECSASIDCHGSEVEMTPDPDSDYDLGPSFRLPARDRNIKGSRTSKGAANDEEEDVYPLSLVVLMAVSAALLTVCSLWTFSLGGLTGGQPTEMYFVSPCQDGGELIDGQLQTDRMMWDGQPVEGYLPNISTFSNGSFIYHVEDAACVFGEYIQWYSDELPSCDYGLDIYD